MSGRTRFVRLYHIGTASTVLAVDALKAAVHEAQKGDNIENYENAVAALRRAAGGPDSTEATIDEGWVDRKSKRNTGETLRLEAQLKEYRNNLIKESIRVGGLVLLVAC